MGRHGTPPIFSISSRRADAYPRAHADIHRAHSLPRERLSKIRACLDSAFPPVADIDLSPLRPPVIPSRAISWNQASDRGLRACTVRQTHRSIVLGSPVSVIVAGG